MCLLSAIVHPHQTPKQWQPLVSDLNVNISKLTLFLKLWYSSQTASQLGVLYKNIQSFKKGNKLSSLYDGYASCPLVTGYDSCIMAEFDYNLQPKETFPFRQDCERYSMFLLKRDIMPLLYWKLMLNGYWNGPEPYRKLFSIFKRN